MPADHAVQHREKQWGMLILGRNKTVIVTGASQGFGAAIAAELLKRGYDVVATSRSVSGAGFASPPQLAPVDGGITLEAASENITRTAVEKFGSINHVVNNAGILGGEPFLEYSIDDIRSFVSTNLDGFIFLTRLAVIQAPEAPELPQSNDGSERRSESGRGVHDYASRARAYTDRSQSHRDDRVATVISGIWRIGYGERFDESKLKAPPAGSYYSEPPGQTHFAETGDEPVVVQIAGFGPSSTDYVGPASDPRNSHGCD